MSSDCGDWLDIKEDLCNYVQVIDSGTFATSGPVTNAHNPGLFVQGIGKIGLPLSDRDAADLSRASHEAPFGKGSETFVDPSIRKTWELNPGQFELRNPAWPSTLHKVVEKVAEELGVVNGASGIRAELHKLLLYEQGAFFDKHRDTEKAPGMFATLVIALPSEHTGGDVSVRLRDEEQVLRTQDRCDFGYSYLACLGLWREQDLEFGSSSNSYEKLVYILEHEYSEANLCLDNLKGKDQLRTRNLLEACQAQGFCLYFAHLEYTRSGSVDEYEDGPYGGYGPSSADYHELIDETDAEWRLQTVFQYDGKQIAADITLEEEDLLENIDITDIEPDDEECDGWTGNEGCTATHFYRRTCAVIVPKTHRFDFLLTAETINVQEYTEALLREMQDETLSVATREELEKFCERVIVTKKSSPKPPSRVEYDSYDFGLLGQERKTTSSRVPDEELASFGKATLRLDRPDLLEKLVKVTSTTVPPSLFQELGRGLHGLDISLWQTAIKMAISRIHTISERLEAVDLLVSSYRKSGGNEAAAVQKMEDLEREMAMSMTETLDKNTTMTEDDAQSMMQLSERYGKSHTFQVILPLVKKHTSNMGFILSFLTALFRAGEAEKLRVEMVQNVFKDILADVIPDLDLHRRDSPDFGRSQVWYEYSKRRRLDYYPNHATHVAPEDDFKLMTADKLATLFLQCEKLGFVHEINQLANKIGSFAPTANTASFENLLLPLLKQLPPVANQGSDSLSTLSYANVFRTVIKSYLGTYVQSPPPKPTGFERQPRGCGPSCEDCVSLDAFLKDAKKPVAHFAVKAKRREHLEDRLRASTCSTETLKHGTPYTLVVQKRGMEWENAVKEWGKRCGVANQKVEEIGVETLRGLLGDEWENAVGLRGIRAGGGEENGDRRPLGALGQGKGASGAGDDKVKGRGGAEIIDLSGD